MQIREYTINGLSEFFNPIVEELTKAMNSLHPMRGIEDHHEWYIAGTFMYNSKTYSFMANQGKGTFRCMESANYANEWFKYDTIYKELVTI